MLLVLIPIQKCRQAALKSKYAAMFSLKTIVSATLVLIILLSMALLSAPSRAWITGIKNLASSCERMTTNLQALPPCASDSYCGLSGYSEDTDNFATNIKCSSSPATFTYFYPGDDNVSGNLKGNNVLHVRFLILAAIWLLRRHRQFCD